MALFATPFLVVNLGCEMIYVVEQRLRAQDIPLSKSERVLAEVCGVLLHERLLSEVWVRQPPAAPGAVRRLLLDVCGASIMRLDERSAGKLWELATAVLRWQVHLAASTAAGSDAFDMTARRLRGVAALLPAGAVRARALCDRARRRFDQFAQELTAGDLGELHEVLQHWLSGFHTKVSVLMRLGLQNNDGSFTPPERVERRILDNLGENIYTYESEKDPGGQPSDNTGEISCLLTDLAGFSAPEESTVELRLPFDLGVEGESQGKVLRLERNTKFESIDISIQSRGDDLSFNAEQPRSAQEDLLTLLEQETDI